MTLWLVEGLFDYEGSYFLGIFSSKRRAQAYVKTYEKTFIYDEIEIKPVILDEKDTSNSE